MCTLCQARDPNSSNCDQHTDSYHSGSSSSGSASSNLPVYSYDQISEYITEQFWEDFGTTPRHYDIQSGGTITYNLSGLDAQGQQTALKAFEAWTAVSGLQFEATSNAATAMMVFQDDQSGAYAFSSVAGGHIIKSTVNVHTSWQNYGDYYFQILFHRSIPVCGRQTAAGVTLDRVGENRGFPQCDSRTVQA